MRRNRHGCFLSLVHSVRAVLAAGPARASAIPNSLATAIAAPYRGDRCKRRAGAGLGRGDAAIPSAKRTLSTRIDSRERALLSAKEGIVFGWSSAFSAAICLSLNLS